MKRKDVLISLAIIAVCIGALYLYSFTNSLVHGYVRLDSGDATALLKIRGNFFSKDIEVSGSEPVQINNRIVTPRYLTISKTVDGKSMRLTSYGPWGNLSKLRIKNNETLDLKVGTPLVIKPTIKQQSGLVSIGFSVYGQSGERYAIPKLPDRPGIKIIDEKGEILASGSFSYG